MDVNFTFLKRQSILLCISLLFSAILSAQAIRYVKQGGTGDGSSWANASGNLQAMINAAGAGSEVWVAAGTYQPASGQFYSMKEGVKIYGGFPNSGNPNMAVRNWQTNVSVLRGNNNSVVRNNNTSLTNASILDGFTLTGGNATTTNQGGAIFNSSVSPALSNLVITQNTSFYGGGIFNIYSSPILNNVSVTNNSATFGGAMDNQYSTISINNSNLSGNTAQSGGGGLYNVVTSAVLYNVTINNNTALGGGGIAGINSPLTLQKVVISNNVVTNNGGGLSNSGSAPVLTNVIISGNSAGQSGGGMYNAPPFQTQTSNPILTNVVISGNTASTGGGIYNTCPSVLTNVTIAGNSAANGGSIYNSAAFPEFKIRNSIISNNSSGVSGIWPENYYSLVQDRIASSYYHNPDGSTNPLFINPLPPGLNSGGDYGLQTGSPLISMGNSGYYTAAQVPDISNTAGDAVFNPRFLGSAVEIGAYEYMDTAEINIRYVKEGATGSGYSWENPSGNLQAMINESAAGNEVWVAAGTYQPASEQSFSMKEGVKIYGGFPDTGNPVMANRNWENNVTILLGNGYAVINNSYNGLTGASVLNGFTITGGTSDFGGGIFNTYASPSLINLVIKNNTAEQGGGAYNFYSSPTFTNVIIAENSPSGISNAQSFPVLTNVTLSRNSATAIANTYNSSAVLRNSIIYGNGIVDNNSFASSNTITYSLIQGIPADAANHNPDGSLNPMFTDAANGNYTLHPYSPAVNAGSNSYYAAGQMPDLSTDTTDLAGNTRFYNNGTVDMGAYELQETPVVTRRYVKQGGTGNGYTWQNASGDLQAMINESAPGNEVWVAAGTYNPNRPANNLQSPDPGNRLNAFVLKADVKIFGGFPANSVIDGDFSSRNYNLNPTVLSGDFNGDDIFDANGLPNGNTGENAFHVVISAQEAGSAELNGFTITGANSNGSGSVGVNGSFLNLNAGGGLCLSYSSPVLTNLVITKNSAGMGSSGGGGGAGLFSMFSNSAVTNVVIAKNTTPNESCIILFYSNTAFTNVTVSGNYGSIFGGITTLQSAFTLKNSIVWGNSNGSINNNSSTPIISHSIIEGSGGSTNWDSTLGTDNGNNIDNDAKFADPVNGNYSLLSVSPAINAGSNSYFNSGQIPNLSNITTDIAQNSRFYNNGIIDIGAYEYQGDTECTVTTTWNGNSWDNGVPVSSAYRAVIQGEYSSTGNLSACSLTVNEGNVVVNTGHTFTIKGAVTVTPYASLTFNNNAALVQIDNTANTGTIILHKSSNPLYRLDYTLWSSPVTGQNVQAFSPQTTAGRFYEYGFGYDAAANNGNGGYVEQYWTVDAATTSFEAAKGYLIRMPNGNLNVPGYNAGTASYAFDGVFTGTPHNGTLSRVASTEGLRYTAVGNPYPSPVSVADFFTQNANAIDGGSALYFWRKKNNATVSSYASLTLAAYTANSAASSGNDQAAYFTGSNVNWLISQGQGFIVKTKDNPTDANIHFTNSMRRAAPANGNQAFLRTAQNSRAEQNNASRLWLNLTGGQGSFSQAAVAYIDGATLGLDYGYDGRELADGGNVSLYSLAGTANLAIQARPVFTVNDVVPLGFTTITSGEYTIALDRTDGIFTGGQDIYLKDNLLGIIHDLKAGDYVFMAEEGTFNERFEIVYTAQALGIDTPNLNANNIIIFKEGNDLKITSGNAVIKDITIYDIRGRKLYSKATINATQATITGLQVEQQVLIVQVDTLNGTVSKRIVY